MVGRSFFLVSLSLVLAFACDSKRSADDDEDGRGDGGDGASTSSGGTSGKGSGGASGGSGGASGGSGGSNAQGGDGQGESGAPSSGGSGGATGGDGGTESSGGSGGSGGDGGTESSGGQGATGGSSGTGGATGGNGGTGGSIIGGGGTAGTGGSIIGGGGTAGTGGGTAGTGACGSLIDDMEAGTGYICQGNGRTGSWFSYVSTYGTFNPPGIPVPPSLLPTPRGESTRAMRAYGTNDDYAGFGCWLVTTPETYDASAYTGIRFFAMGTNPYLNVIIQTSGTEATEYGGTCQLPTLQCAGNSLAMTLSTTWKQFDIPFTSFVGGTVPLNPGDLWSIEFQPGSTGAFDFYVDDLSFY